MDAMKPYRTFQFLSLDIVGGAMASSLFASRMLEARPGWAWWVALGITVWLLYTGDHLLDAWKFRKKGLRDLHRFIFNHRRILMWIMGIAAVTDLMIIFNFLGTLLVKYALLLAGLVLLFYAMRHLFRRNRLFFIPGEVFVLLLYMAGTWLGPWVARQGALRTSHALVAILFTLVLLMNLGVISLYDVKLDSRMGVASLARSLGTGPTRKLLLLSGLTVFLLTLLQFLVNGMDRYTQFTLILAGMATILLLVLLLPSLFGRNDYYRWAADAVLLMGFLSLLVGRG